MANKSIFGSQPGPTQKPTDTVNAAGGAAYGFDPKHALAQIAVTGTFNNTFYADAKSQLDRVLEYAGKCDPVYVAKVAVYARRAATMKDMPAALCAHLFGRAKTDPAAREALKACFPLACDTPKVVRNFVQMVRSNAFGRKSFGHTGRRLLQTWLAARNGHQLFRGSVGKAGSSLADVIRLSRVRPESPARAALYAYLTGFTPYNALGVRFGETDATVLQAGLVKAKEAARSDAHKKYLDDCAKQIADNWIGLLPPLIQQYEAFRRDPKGWPQEVPAVPHELVTDLPLERRHWEDLVKNGGWHFLRMNLNTFKRHGLFEGASGRTTMTQIAARLADKEAIQSARAMPHQLLAAYKFGDDLSPILTGALHDALEVAVQDLPALPGKVFVALDVSGSMNDPITGKREGATTKMRNVDVAALIAASILRKNPDAAVVPFNTSVLQGQRLEPRDTVMTTAQRLSGMLGGGTAISAPFEAISHVVGDNNVDAIVLISDNQAWAEYYKSWNGPSPAAQYWARIKSRSPRARLVLIDISVHADTQIADQPDVLNVGGWNDACFGAVARFLRGESRDTFVATVEATELLKAPVQARADDETED